ncbi:Uncharacterized glycosyltransferase ykoT [Porphyromonas macacae]|uniref:Uncharacterized glycosyltransferase ykoT n=1 Tax=Porphyromonas macacae TaxID=28115 RepID=A0A379E8S3_9PORP|nr:glycosyltransferase family 2 protein [Porphyromonas macacae]SUB89075.1 Uncharacterized glycosyltransferase ykoT [Porphyromonas macacae]
MIKLGIISPCYNEHEVLPHSIEKLTFLLNELVTKKKITPDSFILLVNDGSMDNTWDIISRLHQENEYVYGINLARNVGHQNAIMAGMMTAKNQCDAVITIDVDLQDDINAIESMVDRQAEGYDIVYGVKVSRTGDSFVKRNTALAFYKLQESMGIKAVYNHADFRLMSRRALEALSHYEERNLYLRGLVPLIGFKSATVDDVISERAAGKSKYTFKKMLTLALDGITSFSTKPISLIFGIGVLFLIVSIIIAGYVLVSYWEHKTVPGWTSLMLSVWFIGSILLMSLGVLGEYIGKIYTEIKNRPLYTIESILWKKDK